jgi:hypothetical protein
MMGWNWRMSSMCLIAYLCSWNANCVTGDHYVFMRLQSMQDPLSANEFSLIGEGELSIIDTQRGKVVHPSNSMTKTTRMPRVTIWMSFLRLLGYHYLQASRIMAQH